MADIIEITPPGNDAAITANALPPTVGYAYPENQAPVVPAPAAVAPERSPYAKALDDLERADSQQVRANVMAAKNENPDTTARALTVAKRFGIGVDVAARNLADFEAIKKANDYEGILRGSPMLKQWLTTPVNTGVAIDDVEKLSGVESIWRGLMDTMVRAPAGQAVGFVGSTMYGLGEAYDVAARTTSRLMSEAGITSPAAGVPLPWYLDPAQILKRPGKAIKEFAKDIDVPQNRLNLADEIVGGVGQIAAQVGAVIATGGGAGLAMLFGQGVDQMIDDVEKSGKAGTFKGDLALVGVGLVTAISEKIGLDLLMNRVPPAIKNKFIRAITDIAIAGGIEAAEEAVEKIGQNVLSNYYLETDKHLLEGAGHDALVAGGSAALVRAMLLGAGRFRNRRDNQGTPLPPAEAQAEHAATSIDKMIEMANSTKLATIAPEKLQEFLATLPGQDQDKTVFVPVETVETYMQDMTSIEAANFADRLGITEQLARARVSNEDIAIPLARYVTGASEAHAKWRNDIRTEVDGFSVNQAQEWEKTREETTKAAIARFEEQIAAGVVPDGQTRVFEHVRDQLRIAGKYTNEVAAQHAALYAARYGARAARSPGKYADAWDAFQQAGTGRGVRIESVLPDGTRAMGPDQLDILLDSIRSGKDPELRKLPQQDAQVRTAQEAAVAGVLGEATPAPQTPAQAAAERQAAALTKFRTDRQELADALAGLGVDIATASNADIRAAIQKAVAERAEGRTFEQRAKDVKGNAEGEAEDAKWRSLKPGVTSTGKIKGAPSWVEDSRDLTKLRNLLKQFVEEGIPGRFWYENSARTIMRIVRNDILEARKLIGLVALYSPQTPVFTNMNFAIAAYEQYARGEEIDVKTGFQNRAALAWLRDGTDWGGRKTNSFYQNLTDDILANATPEQLAQFPKDEIEESEKRRATVDLWVLRAMGYDVDAAGSAGKRIKDDDSSGTKYGFSENEIKRLAGNLNKSVADGDPRWTPHQVQAALWTAIKARFEIPKVKADTMAESKEKGYLVERVNKKTGKTEWGPPAQGAPTRSAHMGVWRKHALKAPVEEVKKQVEIAKGAFSDAVDRVAQNITWEAIPSTGIAAEINDASDAVKRAFTRDAVALIVDEEGNDLLSEKLGVSLNYFELGTGAYAGSLNPNVISTLIPEKPAGSFDATSADLYARAIQFIFKQDAVPLFRADARADLRGGYSAISPEGRKRHFDTQREAAAYAAERDAAALDEQAKRTAAAKKKGEDIPAEEAPSKWRVEGNEYALGLKLTYAQPLDNAAETALLASLQKVLGADAGYTRMDDRSVVVINYRGDGGIPFMDDEAFAAGIRAYIEGEGKNHGIQETIEFGAEGRYGPVHDWAAAPDGAVLSDGFAGRPDLQSWLHDRQQAFDALLADYSGEGLAIREQEIGRAEREGSDSGVDRTYNQSAYHGSPHIFERFSLDNVGTGEGAQAYGWGLYLAGRKEVAQHYREKLSAENSDPIVIVNGERYTKTNNGWTNEEGGYLESDSADALAIDAFNRAQGDTERAITMLRVDAERGDVEEGASTAATEILRDNSLEIGKPGRLYTVEIPDDGAYLLWDKPLSEQPEAVQKAVAKLFEGHADFSDDPNDRLIELADSTGKEIYEQLADDRGGQKTASLALREAGVPGIKYLDGSSRKKGEGDHNYVLFDDSLISITTYEQIVAPQTEAAILAAFNENVPSIKDQYYRWASEKQGDTYQSLTVSELEDMFGDEIPPDVLEIAKDAGSVVLISMSENSEGEFLHPDAAPSLDEHMETVVREQDGVFPADTVSDINYSETYAVYEAFKVLAGSMGWKINGRNRKYFSVTKAIPEDQQVTDQDGEKITEVSVGIRIANHPNTSAVGHAIHGKSEVHINIAPGDGMNDAHTIEEAADLLGRATVNEDGEVFFGTQKANLFQEARGSITFAENAAIIRLFQGRDLSTLIHESGHLWLQELEFDAKAADAPDAVKADWQTVLDFVGSKDGYITTEQHELFARAFETYTMEGKAPSEGLRSAFRSFRNWLVGIYRKLASLDAPISPEMRQVFDRLIATEEEIASAADTQGLNPVFTDAKSADMTEAEFKAYTKRVNAVVDEAEQKLLDKTMADIRRQRTKEWKAEQAATRIEVRDEVMADPGQAALHLLRRGELFGQETPPALKGAKLDRAELVSLVGEDGLARLPATIYKANGVPLEAIAGAVGVASPVELIERLAQLEAEQKAMAAKGDTRSVANAQIAEETMKRMTERHGDPLNDGTIEQEAMDAIHGDKRGPLLAADLRVLARKAGHSGTISIKDIEGWASDTIGGMSNYLGTQFAKYQRAERVAGQKVQRALVKGDFVAAFKAKQDQLVNFALYREAKKAAADMEAAVKLNDRYASVEFIKNMDQTALDQIHQLQEQYDFKRRSGKTLAERTTFSMWKAEQEAAGFEVIDPPRLGDVGAIHYSQMTVDELRGLTDTIKQIAHLGRWKQEMKDGEKKRQFEAIVEEAVQTAGKIDQRGVDQSRRGKTSLQAALGDAAHRIRSVDSSLLKLETMFEWLDNDKTGRGVFSRVIFKRMSEAQTKEHDMQADLNKRLAAIYETVPMAQRKKWADVLTVPELPRDGQPGKFNKSQLIAVALNIGNESNLDKMLRGEKWNYDDMMAALNRHLTKEEWGFVQGSWDLVNSLWPEVEAMEKRVNGVAPPKVDAREVETAYGKFAGGYYPAKYDARESLEAEHIQNKSGEGLFDPLRLRATTRSGSTRSRKEGFAAKIKLDLSVLSSHLNEISHDLAFREAVMDSYKFLTDKRVMAAVDSAIGSEYRQQMEPWLKNIANEWANDNRGAEGIEGVARVARTNVTMVGMGFRLSTMFSQVAGFANSAQRLGTRALADGMRAVASDPRGQAAMVAEKSGEMRHRFNNLDRDIRAAMQKYEGQTGPLAEARRFAFVGIGYFDMAVTVPTWIGAYNQGLAQKMTEDEAVYFADKTVRDTQGAGAAKDLAKVQRGGEMMRLFTMFYSYFNVFYNRQRGLARDMRDIKNVGAMNVLAQSFWLLIVPSLLGQYLSGQGPEDDEDLGSWAVRNIAFGLFMGVPWARDVASTANNMAGGKSFGGAKLSPVQGIADGAFHAGKDLWHTIKGEDASKTAVKSAFSAIGLAFGLPTGQIGQTSQYVWDVVAKGSENPQNLLEWMKGLTFGPERKK